MSGARPVPTSLSISVVIPTRDRPDDLSACLAALAASHSGAVSQVILVDDASRVPVRIQVLDLPFPVVVLRTETRLGADAARNLAASRASGSHLAFLDDDARVCPDWEIVASQAVGQGHRAFTGRVLRYDDGLVSRARQWRYDQRYARHGHGDEVRFLAGGNSVVDRDAFHAAGGFPLRGAGGDNALVVGLKLIGVPCVFVPHLRILHRNSKGFCVAVRQAWRSGRIPSPGPGRVLAEAGPEWRALRAAPAPVAMLNGLLQAVHIVARLTFTSHPHRPAERVT